MPLKEAIAISLLLSTQNSLLLLQAQRFTAARALPLRFVAPLQQSGAEVGSGEGEGTGRSGRQPLTPEVGIVLVEVLVIAGDAFLTAEEVVFVLVDLLYLCLAELLEFEVSLAFGRLLLVAPLHPIGLCRPHLLPHADVRRQQGAHLSAQVANGVPAGTFNTEIVSTASSLMQHRNRRNYYNFMDPPYLVIHKHPVPTLRFPKTRFQTPTHNRYFARIKPDKAVIALPSEHHKMHDLSLNLPAVPTQTHSSAKEGDLGSSSVLSRSASIQPSLRGSGVRKQSPLITARSLPKMEQPQGKQLPWQPSEIIRSELSCFNYYSIMKLRDELENRQEGNGLSRVSSDATEEEAGSEAAVEVEVERSYEEYHQVLVEKEPEIYRRKRLKLKHKADWSIAK